MKQSIHPQNEYGIAMQGMQPLSACIAIWWAAYLETPLWVEWGQLAVET